MPEVTISGLLGSLMITFGDVFILICLMSAILTLLIVVVGKLSPKLKRQEEELRFGLISVFLLLFLVAAFVSKRLTPDLVGLENGMFFGFSDLLFIMLCFGIVIMLVITAFISFSGSKNSQY